MSVRGRSRSRHSAACVSLDVVFFAVQCAGMGSGHLDSFASLECSANEHIVEK